MTAWALTGIGFTKLSMGLSTQAEGCFQESLAIQRIRGDRKGIVLNVFYLSKTAFFTGQFDEAQTLAENAHKLAADYNIYAGKKGAFALLALLSAIRGEDSLRSSRLCAEALAMRETLLDWDFWLDINLGLAVRACAEGDWQTARQHHQAMLNIATPRRRPQFMTMCLPVGAMILAHEGKEERAVELLGLAFAHPDSQNGWMENWPLLMCLCSQLEAEVGPATYLGAWVRGTSLDLYSTVRTLFNEEPSRGSVLPTQFSATGPLTEREIQILRLVAAGMSNREIADQLIFAVGTVKWYINQIYSKLYVARRTQAVARVRELHLLP